LHKCEFALKACAVLRGVRVTNALCVADILAQRHNERNTILGCLLALRLIAPVLDVDVQSRDAEQAARLALLIKVSQ